MAEELAANYNVVVIDTVDVPGYKAIVIQAPDVNNPVFRDSRFVNYNLADNNSGVGELNAVSGHNTQLKWNQTIPYGIKRIIPISNETIEVSNSSNSASTKVNNTMPNSVVASETLRPTNQTGGNTTSNVDIAILDTGISLNHPDLNVYRNISFVDGIPSGDDPIGHGSHVAGIAAAKDNSIGVVGATLSIAEFSVISSAVAQATGDNATMTGGNMTGNMTSGNATVGNASGSVSSLCGYRPC